MQIGLQNYPFTDVVETRVQTPTKTKAINVQIGAGDVISNIPVVMDFPHHQIHEGETFQAQDEQLSIGSNTVKYTFVTPSKTTTIWSPHLEVRAQVYNGTVLIRIYETATSTGGTPLTNYNRNRNSALTSSTVVTTGVTSTDGTLIDSFFIGAGTKSAGSGRTDDEWVTKVNTKYRIDVIGQAAGTQAIVQFLWYEDLGV